MIRSNLSDSEVLSPGAGAARGGPSSPRGAVRGRSVCGLASEGGWQSPNPASPERRGAGMAVPEPDARLAQEKEEESEEESEILEESPCGRWQKRREQVGAGSSPPGAGGAAGSAGGRCGNGPRGAGRGGGGRQRERCGERAVGSGARRAPVR